MKPPKTVTVTVSSGSVSVITIHPLPNTTNPIRLPTNTTLPSEAPFPNATTPSLAPQVSTLSTVLGLETDEPAQRPPAQIPNPIPSKTTSLSPLQALSSVERPDVFTTPVFPPDQPSQRPPSPTSVIPSSPESASPLAATTLKSVEAPESGPAKAPPVVDTFEASTEPAQTVTLTAATLGSVPGLEIEPTQRPATVQAPPGAAAQIQETKSLSVPIIIAPLASLLESVGIAALGGGETSVGAAPPPATAGSDSKAPLTSTARVSTIVESPLPASVPGASEIIAPPPESVPGAPPPSIPTLSTFVTSIAEGLGSVQEAATTSTSSTTSDVAAAPTVTTPPPAEVFQGATAQLAVPRLKAILGFMGLALVIGRVLL
ncbi:MAG: hypothetical protein M1817_004496 [Caeruleum heppii]|nr:MAG: hypothetical protein M1817_004496 [Caeruleum heppii]